ncbi:MAG: NADH-quinone oxidoreductase subunit L [Alphaproteobacteria bacterium]|nr:MAG: NADH-quinone oxidoreductase subunit L [Alphaproteobacteria bacterium]
MQTAATLAVLLPALGALLGGLTYLIWPSGKADLGGHGHDAHADHHDDHAPVKPAGPAIAHYVTMFLTSGSVILAAVASWSIFLSLNAGTLQPFNNDWFTWITVANWQVSFGTLIDKLSATMLIVVTTVSACVHVYSMAYMSEDPSKRRFFIYLSAFTFTMLMLVTAPNLIQMFLGWEGVGVCSYLLIGFWHQKATANAAAIKAFIVNRVADAAMLMGLFTLLITFGSLTYADFLPRAAEVAATNPNAINLMALLLFIGAMGKSAQFGLHTWLPDAMEGPTPVSALIHAATMVTAGVFLLCRLSPLYEAAPQILHIVGWVGAITALFAATVGLTQTDIKRVIAYSTCSQLGYMFFAIGVSAYPAAMFHLTTHAFFKALLFLGAGSVIHGMHHEQNIFNYAKSGYVLRKLLPITYGLMWLGSLALAGIPPFAGYFSKDLILESAFAAPGGAGLPLYVIGTFAAMLTAIYGFRIIFMSFHNKEAHAHAHTEESQTAKQAKAGKKTITQHAPHDTHHALPHESPWLMLAPMMLLAVGAVLSGYLLKNMGTIEWWQGAIVIDHAHTALHDAHHIPEFFKKLPLILAICGITLSFYLFAEYRGIPKKIAQTATIPYAISLNKWFIDELYNFVWVRPTKAIALLLAEYGDKRTIDGLINGTAATTRDFGLWLRGAQTGYLYHYAFAMLVALTLGLGYLLWKML